MKKKVSQMFLFLFVILFLVSCDGTGEISEITIDFVVDGQIYHQMVYDGKQSIVFPEPPTKEDFVFDGWYLDNDTWQDEFTPSYQAIANITVYAKWNEYRGETGKIYVLFVGETIEIDQLEITEGSIILPVEPQREGYDFVGWFFDSEFSEKFENENLFETTTIYGKWEIKTFNVTWKCDDEVLLFYENVDWDTLPEYNGSTPTKEGYTFIGWSPELSAVKENQTYIAQFIESGPGEIISYLVKFYDYDNTLLKEEIVNHGSLATAPENPDNKIGYRFISWDKAFSNVTSDLVVIAQYELIPDQEQIQIIWKDDDGSIILIENINFPTYPVFLGDMPIKEGYKFLGWQHNGALLISLFGVTETTELYASWTSIYEDFSYRTEFNATTNRTEASITGYVGIEKSIVIPSEIDGLVVTKIAEDAFARLEVDSVVIPDSVLQIGIRAFSYCSLTQVILPSYLKSIERNSFANSKIISITIPQSVLSIGNDAFYGSELQEIFFADDSKLEYIGKWAFQNSKLKSIVIPDSVLSIGDFAFGNCTLLAQVTFKEESRLEIIETGAFSGCIKLRTFNMPSSVLSLGMRVFDSYELRIFSDLKVQPAKWNPNWKTSNVAIIWDFKELIIVDDVIYVLTGDNKAIVVGLVPDSNIEEIIVKSEVSGVTVNEICDYAFTITPTIKSIEIPNTITYIGETAFGYGYQVEINMDFVSEPGGWHSNWNSYGINVNWKQSDETILDGIRYLLLNNNDAIVIGSELSDSNLNLVIPSIVNGHIVTGIGAGAFLRNENIVSVFIPSSVKVIGNSAFYSCSNLKEVIFEDDSELVTIDNDSFSNCNSLLEIMIPKSVVYIKGAVFLGCGNLETVIFFEDSKLSSIGQGAFSNSGIKVIDLPQSVIEIGSGVFNYCRFLTNVTLPNSITVIPSSAFNNCVKLESVFIPKNVETIGNYSFSYCQKLKLIEFESGSLLTTIESQAFSYSGIETISLGSEVRHIGTESFWGSLLTSITIPNSVETIGSSAFNHCYNLERVVFESGSNLTILQRSVFGFCSSLKSIEIPASVSIIERNAFNDCMEMTSLTFEENSQLVRMLSSDYLGVTEIRIPDSMIEMKPNSTFEGWTALEKIYIPATVTYFDGASLRNCFNLKEIIVDENNQTYCSVDGVLYYKDLSRIIKYPNSKTGNSFEIPDSVLVIGSGAFANSLYLKNITIPQGVIVIESYAFERLLIDSITVPNSVVTIGASAFEICQLLTEVIFEEDSKLEYIGKFAFAYSALKSIVIPDSVVSLGEFAFRLCNNLESTIIGDGVSEISKGLFNSCGMLLSIQFGKNITSIGEEAFYGCSMLTKINIPNEVTRIGERAFEYCSNLAEVTFGEDSGLRTIGNYAFATSAIREIMIPEGVTNIGERAFSECRALVTVIFKGDSELRSISAWLFYGCSSLIAVEFEKTSKITEIGEYAFAHCYSLFEFDFPDSLVEIGEYAFSGCYGLEKIVLDGNIESIGSGAFQQCLNVKTIIIGESVTFIDQYVFEIDYTANVYIGHTRKPEGWHDFWAGYINHFQLYWSNRWHYDQDGNPVAN